MKFFRRFRALFRKDTLDAEMAEEMRLHVELQAERKVAAGMKADEARFAAQREFGNVARLQEEARDVRGWGWLEDLQKDLRYSVRYLRQHRGFTATVVLTLMLGIGATTTIFTVLDAHLRPVPAPHSGRLVRIWESNPQYNISQFSVSYPNFADWKARLHGVELLTAIRNDNVNLLLDGNPERVSNQYLSSDAFPLFGWRMIGGRPFANGEDAPGKDNVAILSERLWRRLFAADLGVIGRALTINGRSHTVIGVVSGEAEAVSSNEIFLPLGPYLREDRSDHQLDIYARLKESVTPAQAAAEMNLLAAQLEKENPDSNTGWRVNLIPLIDAWVGASIKRTLILLFAAVGLLLLIACANFSTLLLVRASMRTRELAIRTALGGGRGRLMRQLLTESLLLALMGGAAGVWLSYLGLDFFRTFAADSLPRMLEVEINARVLWFSCAATLVSALLAGFFPAWQASRVDVQAGLKKNNPNSAGGKRAWRNCLLIGQLGTSLILLAGAGLMVRTLYRLHRTELGFNPNHVLMMQLAPTQNGTAFFAQLTERLAALPGVEGVAVASSAPMSTFNTSLNYFPVGPSKLTATPSLQCQWRIVSGDYFRTMQVPLLRGRTFTPHDDERAPRVAVVSQTFARTMWGEEDPIGKQVNPGGGTTYTTVVGVVGDVRNLNPALPPEATYYMPAHRWVWDSMTLMIRTSRDAPNLVPEVRSAVKALDATLPLYYIRTMSESVAARLGPQRVFASLLAVFAGVALLLAVIGLYGAMSYVAAQRTREIGIRLALGAQRADLMRPLLREGILIVAAGVALGLTGAFLISRVLRSLLSGVSPNDPVAFLAATAALAASALLACWLPARRAAKVEPVVALRAE